MDNNIFPKFEMSEDIKSGVDVINDVVIGVASEEDREFIGASFDKKNLRFFLLTIFLLIIILFVRLTYLQVIKGEYYFSIAEGNRIKTEDIKAKRGVIYDRNMNQLVYNRANFVLEIVPADYFLNKNNSFFETCKKIKTLCSEVDDNNEKIKECEATKIECKNLGKENLRNILKKEQSEYYLPKIYTDDIDKFFNYFFDDINIYSTQSTILAEKISYQDSLILMNKIKNVPGLILDVSNTREYIPIDSMSHWIGYTGRIDQDELAVNTNYSRNDYIGKTGLEKYYENILKGKNGKKEIEVNAVGREKGTVSQFDPVSGSNLVLSIDSELQKKSEEIFNKYLTLKNKTKGSVIIMNPNNGEILAMISTPTFSVNDFSYKIDPDKYKELIENKDMPLFNRSVMGEYPSGSIIKPVVAVAALQEGIITPWTTFFSSGGIAIGDWFFPDWLAQGHGVTNVRKALANSINTFFYIAVGGYNDFVGLGIEKFKKYGELFGLNASTGIDLPYEQEGFFPTKEWKMKAKGEQWYVGDTYHLAIGQGDLLITPLQAAVFTSIIANGGTYYKPHFLKEIDNEKGEIISVTEPEVIRSGFVSKENLGIVSRGMRDCVTYGSCVALNSLPFEVAGKTGTAQHGVDKEPHAWFSAFAPFENPEVVIVVLVEEGEGGTKISVPVAKEILAWYFSR